MAPLMASGHRPYIPMPQGRGFTDAMINLSGRDMTVFFNVCCFFSHCNAHLAFPCLCRR